ncbi:MAG: mechanosensitive ion channel [bacterium]|nr:mechanosensitive ion channel [bacterium]
MLIVLLCSAPFSAGGQEESEPETAPAEPIAIPVPAVAESAEVLDARLESITDRIEAEASLDPLILQLPETRRQIAERQEETRAQIEALRLEGLGDLEREWQIRGAELQETAGGLTELGEEFESQLEELQGFTDVWTKTREAIGSASAPETLELRVDQVLESISRTRLRLRERRGLILTVQTSVGELQRTVASLLSTIEDAQKRLRSRLLVPDRPPLWSVEALAGAEGFTGSVTKVSRDIGEQLRTYFATRRTVVFLHILLFLGSVLLTLYLRPRTRTWAERDEGFRSTARLFDRPIALAALMALLFSPWVYPNAPSVLNDLMGLLFLLPILRLLPILLESSLRHGAYALACLYLVDQLRALLDSEPLLERSLFALEIAVAFVGLLWLLRPARASRLPLDNPWLRAIGIAARVASVLLAASFLLNLLGYMGLARLLGEGTLRSAYAGLFIYVAVIVAEGLLRALLRVRIVQFLNLVRRHRPVIVRRIRWIARAAGVATWIWVTLEHFSIEGQTVRAVDVALTTRFGLGEIQVSLGDLLVFAITIALALFISRALRMLLDEDVLPRVSLPRGVGYATSATVQYAVAMLGFLVAMSAAGIDMDRFAIVAGAFGVGLGFGLQNVVNNFVSGIILLFERPVQVGDTVETEGVLGEVRRIGIRSSTIRTWQGAEVIVPNSSLIAERVVNWTMSDRQRRIDLSVGVAYGTDPERVLEILDQIAAEHDEILDDPKPISLFRGFGDSSLDFELRAWTPRFENFNRVFSELAVRVNSAFARANIEIPFPQRDLHLKSVEPDAARSLRAEASASGEAEV